MQSTERQLSLSEGAIAIKNGLEIDDARISRHSKSGHQAGAAGARKRDRHGFLLEDRINPLQHWQVADPEVAVWIKTSKPCDRSEEYVASPTAPRRCRSANDDILSGQVAQAAELSVTNLEKAPPVPRRYKPQVWRRTGQALPGANVTHRKDTLSLT
jgi:hypothetical protein